MLKQKNSQNDKQNYRKTVKQQKQSGDYDINLKQTCDDYFGSMSNEDVEIYKNKKKKTKQPTKNDKNREVQQYNFLTAHKENNNYSEQSQFNEYNYELLNQESQQPQIFKKSESIQDEVDESNNKQKRKLYDAIFSSTTIVKRFKFTHQTKFYLFGDQIIDLNHLRSVLNNTQADYIREQQPMSTLQCIKFVNNIIHRMDNKYIQVQSEVADRYLESIDPIIKMIQSLGDKDLFDFSDIIQALWVGLVQFRKLINQQSQDTQFQQHKKNRSIYAENAFNKIVSNLDQKTLISYIYYNVDYERQQFDSCCTGFSPALYELLAGNSYAFKQHIQQYGYLDPIHQSYKLKTSVQHANKFLEQKQQKKEISSMLPDAYSELITLDSFVFPVLMKITRIIPEKEYDIQNNLNFNISNLLAIYEFVLLDENIPQQLQNTRQNTQFRNTLCTTDSQDIHPENNILDDLSDLLDKGNKWFKRCGFMDIPKKKIKQQNQDSDNNDDNISTSID